MLRRIIPVTNVAVHKRFATWLRHNKFKNIIGHLENCTNNREKPNPIYINGADYQLLTATNPRKR